MNYDSFKTISWPTLTDLSASSYGHLHQGCSNVMGYSPTDFKFVPGETPMSTFTATATMLISYYIVVFGGRELMKKREPSLEVSLPGAQTSTHSHQRRAAALSLSSFCLLLCEMVYSSPSATTRAMDQRTGHCTTCVLPWIQ